MNTSLPGGLPSTTLMAKLARPALYSADYLIDSQGLLNRPSPSLLITLYHHHQIFPTTKSPTYLARVTLDLHLPRRLQPATKTPTVTTLGPMGALWGRSNARNPDWNTTPISRRRPVPPMQPLNPNLAAHDTNVHIYRGRGLPRECRLRLRAWHRTGAAQQQEPFNLPRPHSVCVYVVQYLVVGSRITGREAYE